MDHTDLLEQTLQILEQADARYCVIGGQAVNAYAEPVVSLDLNLALAPGEMERLGALFEPPIRMERFEHSVNLSAPGSDLRIQFHVDSKRRASKRQKDLADIARLLENHPELRELVPQSIRERLVE